MAADTTQPSYIDPTTTPTGAATPSDYPQGGATSTDSGSSPSILSSLGTLGTSALNFLGSPAGGQIVQAGVAMYEAGKANQQVNQLYAPITQAGQQFTQAGGQQLGATTPALQRSIPGQTQFATQQQGVAQQYGTGQLTATQNQQLQTFVQQQKSQVMAELAKAGINDPNSSQARTAFQPSTYSATYL